MHVEPGHRLDPAAAFIDPRDPNDRPLAQHLVREIGPGFAARRGERARGSPGIDDLVDRGQAGAFVASRLAYRRLLRRSGWLVVPALVGFALFWSFFELTGRRIQRQCAGSRVSGCSAAGSRSSSRVVAVVLVFTVTQLRDALGGVAWWGPQPRGNDDARGEAVTLAAAGGVGLVTAHTRRPELTDLGGGSFYANCGSGGRVVECVPARAGLPPVFVERLRCSWVELEAGADLHARLWHGVRDLPSTTLAGAHGRAATRVEPRGRPRSSRSIRAPSPGRRPATRPRCGGARGASPPPRSRSPASINLASAATLPLASRLGALRRFAPIEVPEAAAVLVALAGVGLLFLARGVRRGQRHAWSLALALLLVSVGGPRREGPRHRRGGAHADRRDLPRDPSVRLRRAGQPVVGAPRRDRRRSPGVAVAIAAGVVGVELRSPRPPIGHTFGAVTLRLFGDRSFALCRTARPLPLAGAPRDRHRHRDLGAVARVPARGAAEHDVGAPDARASGRASSSSATAPTRSRTSRCAPTRTGSASATPSSRTASTTASRLVSPDPSVPCRNGRTRGPRSASSPTSTAGRSR